MSIDQNDASSASAVLTESLTIMRGLGDKRSIAFPLENFASTALLQDDPARAVILAAAATELRQTTGAPLPQSEQKNLDEHVQIALALLGEVTLTQSWDRGKALNTEEAIDFALETD